MRSELKTMVRAYRKFVCIALVLLMGAYGPAIPFPGSASMREILRWKKWLTLAIVILALPFAASAQTFEALPEIDVYYKFDPNLRVYFQAKDTREGGASTTAEIGPSLDFHIKELSKLSDIAAFDLDKSKSQLLLFSIGYRYLPTPNEPPTNRLEPYVTIHLPSPGRLLLSDRNRADLDWKNGNFSWHYRNRIDVERPTRIRGYHLSPYAAVEFWYTSQYSKWSTTSSISPVVYFHSGSVSISSRTTSTRTSQFVYPTASIAAINDSGGP